jgi:predicted amino acid racemase
VTHFDDKVTSIIFHWSHFMYLDNVLENNPGLLEVMIYYHQKGMIPPNTWVIDLDTIAANAELLSRRANKLGLTTYLMSKQHNRNPYINKLALACGLNKMVAVDAQGVLSHRRYNVPLGHAGHLNQIPKHLIPIVVAMNPDVITIYNKEHAEWINRAAASLGVIQDLLIRVYSDDGICFDGQEGGFYLEEIPNIAAFVNQLENIRIVGVTAFPCLKYNETPQEQVELTPNMYTVNRAVEILKNIGLPVIQINTPGNTSCRVMSMLKKAGATHIEPGNAILGTTPDNAFHSEVPEKTAFGYITEISHFNKKTAFAYGGGVYHTNYNDKIFGLVGSTWEEAKNNKVLYDHNIEQDIDYHMQLKPEKGQNCKVGDSAVFVYRTQMHMTRSYVLPISGISGKRELKLHYLFDNANTAMDNNYYPVAPADVCVDIDRMIGSYI